MDILSLVGLVLAAGAIFGGQAIEGGSIGSLLQFAAFIIVVGGTLGAVLLQSPMSAFLEGLRLARWVVLPPKIDHQAAIAKLGEWAARARKDGMLALENELAEVADPYTRNGLQMLVDGFEPEKIEDALHVEIEGFEHRLGAGAKIWEAAGGYAPTIGILGAVMGLIHVMENLSDPNKLGGGIAVAFVATVYGVGSANLIFLPIASKLKSIIKEHVTHRELILDGLLGIANGSRWGPGWR